MTKEKEDKIRVDRDNGNIVWNKRKRDNMRGIKTKVDLRNKKSFVLVKLKR